MLRGSFNGIQVHPVPVSVLARHRRSCPVQLWNLAHLHGETSANAALALDSRSSTCPPPPGMAILVQVRPPLLIWNRYGANTNPAFAVTKATSVTPGRSGSPMRAIGAATLPRRCQVFPPSVLPMT